MTIIEEKKTTEPEVKTFTAKSGKFNFLAEVTALEQAEAVIAGIEETQLGVRPRNFPTANLQKKISDLREAMMRMPAEPESVRQTEIRLRQELGLWRMSLAKRDDAFSAFDLRSYCENVQPPVDLETLAALGKFYRNMPPTPPVLSKFDYLITQYFSNRRDENRRALRLDADKIVAELRRLNHEWTDGASETSIYTQAEIRESIAALARLSTSAKSHKTLKNWFDSEFFNYTRAIKMRLIETFFIPEVTAAIVVCNLVVGNHFAALCAADKEKLTEAAAMFTAGESASQTASTQLSQAFQNLLYFSLEESSAQNIAQERLTNLVTLTFPDENNAALPVFTQPESPAEKVSAAAPLTTEAVAETSAPPPVNALPPAAEPLNVLAAEIPAASTVEIADQVLEAEFISEVSETAAETESAESPAPINVVSELEAVLGTLARHKPNVALIKSYLQKSAAHEIRSLNLAVFLPELADVVGRSDDKTLRRALSAIIRAQDLTRFIEQGEGELLPDLTEEVNLLNAEMQEATQLLRNSMRGLAGAQGEKERTNFENLLYATNTLVETQLRLNSAVVRRQPEIIEEQKLESPAEVNVEKIRIDKPIFALSAVSAAPSGTRRVNFGLLGVTAMLIVLVGCLYFFNFFGTDAVIAESKFKAVELTKLNHGSLLTEARINKETLFAFAGKEWDAHTESEKKEKLRSMLTQSSQFGFNKIIVMNKEGQTVATAWGDEVKLN